MVKLTRGAGASKGDQEEIACVFFGNEDCDAGFSCIFPRGHVVSGVVFCIALLYGLDDFIAEHKFETDEGW